MENKQGTKLTSTTPLERRKALKLYQINLLFIYHVALAITLAYLTYNIWPPQPWPGDTAPAITNLELNPTTQAVAKIENYPPKFRVFGIDFQTTLESRLILLVLLVGAMGSYVHAASSLVDYLGNRTFVSSWVWWYLLKPFVGMLLALIFYFVFRGGFVTAGANAAGESATNFINPYGIAALSALVGMFSKVATDKLNEVFTTLFRPGPGEGDATRDDKLNAESLLSIAQDDPALNEASLILPSNKFRQATQAFFEEPEER